MCAFKFLFSLFSILSYLLSDNAEGVSLKSPISKKPSGLEIKPSGHEINPNGLEINPSGL